MPLGEVIHAYALGPSELTFLTLEFFFGKTLTHVHYGETFCCWRFGIKGGVVELLEKYKEEGEGNQTLGVT